jgi:hypothetical protein
VAIFGCLGVLVILRLGLDSFQPAAFLPLAAAFAFAVALTQAKALTATETPVAILLWMNMIQLPLALMGRIPSSYLALGAADLVPVGAVALTGFASHFLSRPGVLASRSHGRGDAGFPSHSADHSGRLIALH